MLTKATLKYDGKSLFKYLELRDDLKKSDLFEYRHEFLTLKLEENCDA